MKIPMRQFFLSIVKGHNIFRPRIGRRVWWLLWHRIWPELNMPVQRENWRQQGRVTLEEDKWDRYRSNSERAGWSMYQWPNPRWLAAGNDLKTQPELGEILGGEVFLGGRLDPLLRFCFLSSFAFGDFLFLSGTHPRPRKRLKAVLPGDLEHCGLQLELERSWTSSRKRLAMRPGYEIFRRQPQSQQLIISFTIYIYICIVGLGFLQFFATNPKLGLNWLYIHTIRQWYFK